MAAAHLDPLKHGYHRLAKQMAIDPDHAIFRRFGELSVLNVLRLQAELHDMEEQLKDTRLEDGESDDQSRKLYAFDFRHMRRCAEEGDSEQLWLDVRDVGGGFLTGIEASTWAEEHNNDFIGPIRQANLGTSDQLTDLLNGKILDLYHSIIGKRSKKRMLDNKIRLYSPRKITKIGNAIVAAASALFPTIAILVLYFVREMVHRIELVIVFTTLFAIAISLCTNAKRSEVFSATAAFAAVEVVYIGSTSN
ncbi:hypothetical protein PG993_006161 [Apiospora rasikravindrae]|uniref:DUF6594 domain-containing protein n=1 Tax=Apiospora rasikravindrae TaxID=990691 RepID=A0ABR1T4X6_9PEZI